jgi:hypothetical protein
MGMTGISHITGLEANGAGSLTDMMSFCSLTASMLDNSEMSRSSTATLAAYSSFNASDGFNLWN